MFCPGGNLTYRLPKQRAAQVYKTSQCHPPRLGFPPLEKRKISFSSLWNSPDSSTADKQYPSYGLGLDIYSPEPPQGLGLLFHSPVPSHELGLLIYSPDLYKVPRNIKQPKGLKHKQIKH